MITYNIRTNPQKCRVYDSDIIFTTGDSGGYTLQFTFDGITVSGCSLLVKALRADGAVVTAQSSSMQITLPNSVYSVSGDLSLEIAVAGTNDECTTVLIINAYVREGFGENGIEADDRYPVLTALLSDTNEYRALFEQCLDENGHLKGSLLEGGSVSAAKLDAALTAAIAAKADKTLAFKGTVTDDNIDSTSLETGIYLYYNYGILIVGNSSSAHNQILIKLPDHIKTRMMNNGVWGEWKNYTAMIETGLQAHLTSSANPHHVTKAQVGLGNADNTSDASKPVSTAQQAAFDKKESRMVLLNYYKVTDADLQRIDFEESDGHVSYADLNLRHVFIKIKTPKIESPDNSTSRPTKVYIKRAGESDYTYFYVAQQLHRERDADYNVYIHGRISTYNINFETKETYFNNTASMGYTGDVVYLTHTQLNYFNIGPKGFRWQSETEGAYLPVNSEISIWGY